MDVDFWTSSDHHLIKNDSASVAAGAQISSEEDEARAFFPCPFCYIEIELPVFCIHLQEEHCFDLQVCPLCAENLGKNPVDHFSVQHTQSIRRRRKIHKFGLTAQPGLGKELRDLSSYFGSASGNTKNNKIEADPLLSPLFLFHTPQIYDNKYLHDKETFKIRESTRANMKRNSHKPEDQSVEQGNKEKTQKMIFVEDLVMSTIF